MSFRRQGSSWCCAAIAVIVLLVDAYAAAAPAEPDQPVEDLRAYAELSIEDLMNVDVTSVAGVAQEWFQTPAAMYVITAEEIRRSGHRSIAEVLRLAPGVFVGATDSNSWSIGMRGFNGGLANKTLILIDGRSVYDPLFSGTFWDVQDTLLEDIDHIEVIRGPGATLWGANAVNGVINIITRSARDTQGLFLVGGGGTLERTFAGVRYGFPVAENAWLRVWSKYSERDSFERANGTSVGDDWNMARGGFRFDMDGSDGLWLTFQGDLYHSDRIGEGAVDGRAAGGNLLFRLSRQLSSDSGWTLQAYYDHTERLAAASRLEVDRDTMDVDFRHHFALGSQHNIIWGLGFRHTEDETNQSPILPFIPQDRAADTYSAFVQDTITLAPNRLFAMIGSKLEHNDYTGVEVQPSARLWWTPDDRQMIWGSVSRAMRTPSRLEADLNVTSPIILLGDPNLRSEELLAYEAGYRLNVRKNLSLDIAGFYNKYDNLIFIPPTPPFVFNNEGRAEVYGGEVAMAWQPADSWRLNGSYSLANVLVHGGILNTDEGSTPTHMVKLQSYLDITDTLEFNSALSYVDEIPAKSVGPYWRLDLGLTWHVTKNFDLSAWGQNLLDDHHPEFSSAEVPRGFYLMGTIRY